jgi:sugar/nucleoside kinase (ribokinase family)
MAQLDVLVLGDCNPDVVLRGGDVEPAFGQVERLVDDAELLIGGSGAIFACAAARLGLRTALAAVVGDDVFGRFMIDALGERGVDTDPIVIEPGLRTGLTVVLAKPEDRAMLTFPGAIASFRGDMINPELLRSTRHVHVSSFFLQTGLAPSVPELFALARQSGATTSIDPNWDPSGTWDGGLLEALSTTDVFLPNAAEASGVAREVDLERAAAALAQRGPTTIVKNGPDGALAARARRLLGATSLRGTAVVDGTGAGDTFDAGIVTGLLQGWELDRTLQLGCACGALATRAYGGTASQPTLQEALAAMEAYA